MTITRYGERVFPAISNFHTWTSISLNRKNVFKKHHLGMKYYDEQNDENLVTMNEFHNEITKL